MTKIKTGLEIERIQSVEVLKDLREAWNKLLEQNQTQTTELTYEWQTTYWRYFKEESDLFVLVVKEAGSVIGIAPLRLRNKWRLGVRVRCLEFMAARESNYQDFILGNRGQEVLECIVNYLMTHSHEWDVLNLWHIPEGSITGRFVLERLSPRFISWVASVEKCIFFELDKTWEEYSANSRETRRKIAYRMRKLQKHGSVECYHCTSEEQFKATLNKFFELHRQRWNKTETPSQFNEDRNCGFYTDAGLQLLAKGQVDLFVLEVNKTPVAMLFAFVFNQSYLVQLTAFEEAYAQASPSLVMHELFIQQLFGSKIKTFDLGFYYPYKESWGNSYKNRQNIMIYCRRTAGYYDYLTSRLVTIVRSEVKRNSLLLKLAKQFRQRTRLETLQ